MKYKEFLFCYSIGATISIWMNAYISGSELKMNYIYFHQLAMSYYKNSMHFNYFSGYQAHLRARLGSIQWSSTWSSQEQLDAQIGFQNHDWNPTWKLNPICWRKVRKSSINSRFLRCHWTSELVRRCQGIISRENLSVSYIVNKIL